MEVVEPEARRRSTYATALAFLAGLERAGVRHVCISPGSRSTPLAVSAGLLEARSELRCSVHLDERAAGFFALGAARMSGVPAVLVCTSGTAAANYLPAIVEARYGGVPLIVLTADRPPELRDRGAGQTIEQPGLYGANVRWFHELAVPDPGAIPDRLARSLAARAFAEAIGRPRGVAHLNWPLREPLDPPQDIGQLVETACAVQLGPRLSSRLAVPSPEIVSQLAGWVRERERGVIVLGPCDEDPGLAAAAGELARRAGWPLLGEPTSGTRGGTGPVIAHADLFLREPGFARAHPPEVVIRFGRSPTSKSQRLWLEAAPPEDFVLVDPDHAWNDAGALATRWLDADPSSVCRAVCRELDPEPARRSDWLADFCQADRAAAAAIAAALDGDKRLLAAAVVRELADAMPSDGWLYVSNSMAVRDVDAFWPVEAEPRLVLSNRGASGIDGVTSSALGACAASGQHGVLLTGDVALLHDIGGLLAARSESLSLTVVVLDDDGGSIFSYLPIAAHAEQVGFDRLFRTAHGVDLRAAADLAAGHYDRVDDVDAFRTALARSFERGGLTILAVAIDPAANLEQHRALEAAVRAAVPAAVGNG